LPVEEQKAVLELLNRSKSHPNIHLRIFQDVFEISQENGLLLHFFYHEDVSFFRSQLMTGIKKLGLNPPSHIFQQS
jgi:hypothetical protein